MITTEFQTKPGIKDSPASVKHLSEADETLVAGQSARSISLLISLTLNGRLTDRDREWLDSLASDEAICFLIHGDRYLHPEDTPLFPIELIESSMLPCGTSVFSQRFRTKDSPNLSTHRILSTVIGRIDGLPIRFGLFGRENLMADKGIELAFSDSVVALREAAVCLTDLSEQILPDLNSDNPCCLLDRTSGAVMAANDAFAALIDTQSPNLSGASFQDMIADFPRQFSDNRLVIQNTSIAACPLSLVTVGDQAKASSEDNISRFFFHKIRNRLTAITTSASFLKSLETTSLDPDETSLVNVISDESNSLIDELDRFEFIDQYTLLPPSRQSVGAAVHKAQSAVIPDSDWTYQDEQTGQQATIDAPEGALTRLFEAVFQIHSNSGTDGAIAYKLTPDSGELQIQVTSPRSHHDTIKPTYWTTYLRHLCDIMGVTTNELAQGHDENIVSTVTLSISQEKP